MSKSRIPTAALAAAVALVVQTAMAVAQAPAVSDDVVRIGVINDQSGVFADVTGRGSVIAATMAIRDFGGTVLNRPIELVSADHQNKTDIAAGIARRWIDTDGVDALVDGGSSAAGLAIQSIAADKKRIAMFSGPATSDLTGKACSPTGFHWTYDTYALGSGTAQALVRAGADTWFFLTSDYAFGHALERDASRFIVANGGRVLGAVRHPLSTADFSSYLLQAQASRAKIIGLANSGDDALTAIKQAAEFRIVESGQRLGGLLLLINQIHGLGLAAAKGVIVSEAFYWDLDDGTRAFSRRFEAEARKMPNMIQAGVYSAVTHYLKAIKAAGTDEAAAVAARMRELPVEDFMSQGVRIREDGRVMRAMHLFEVKAQSESKGPWDYYKRIATVPGEQAFRPLADGGCPHVAKN